MTNYNGRESKNWGEVCAVQKKRQGRDRVNCCVMERNGGRQQAATAGKFIPVIQKHKPKRHTTLKIFQCTAKGFRHILSVHLFFAECRSQYSGAQGHYICGAIAKTDIKTQLSLSISSNHNIQSSACYKKIKFKFKHWLSIKKILYHCCYFWLEGQPYKYKSLSLSE